MTLLFFKHRQVCHKHGKACDGCNTLISNPKSHVAVVFGSGGLVHIFWSKAQKCLLFLLGRVLSTHWTESVVRGHSVMSNVRGGAVLLLLGLLNLWPLWPVQGALLISRYDATMQVNLLILSFILLKVHLKNTSMSNSPLPRL